MSEVGPRGASTGSNRNPQTPTLPPDNQPVQSRQPTSNVFGFKIPVNDWEAALVLYALGLFMVETDLFGDIYLIGAWSVAMLMFVGTNASEQKKGQSQ